MSSLAIKAVAIVTMLLDHIGYVFAGRLPDGVADVLRTAGRLALPLFCFLIVEGYVHTRDVRRYALRLLTFAVLSELPFDLMLRRSAVPAVFIDYGYQNVFFMLLLGLLAIWAIDVQTKLHRPQLGYAMAVALALVAELIRADYGLFGVGFIVVFFALRGNHVRVALAFTALLALRYTLAVLGVSVADMLLLRPFVQPTDLSWAQTNLFALLALPLCFLANGKKGYSRPWLQWGFYAFYPAHMLVLTVIYRVLYL